MGSHVLLVNGGRWTKKQSHPATRLLFLPCETGIGRPPEPIFQYPTGSTAVTWYPCRICQRETNGTGLRVRATPTM